MANTDQDGVIDLIRKCLALSRSSNEHEAARAAEKAQELLLKYNLKMADVEAREDVRKVEVGHTEYITVNKEWRKTLAHTLATTNFCSMLTQKQRGDVRMFFIGRPINVLAVIETYEWLAARLDQMVYDLTRADMGERGNLTKWRNSWLIGATQTVTARLWGAYSAARENPNVTALTTVSQQELKAYIKQRWQVDHSQPSYDSMQRGNWDAYHQGQVAGQTVSLNKTNQPRNRKQIQ